MGILNLVQITIKFPFDVSEQALTAKISPGETCGVRNLILAILIYFRC